MMAGRMKPALASLLVLLSTVPPVVRTFAPPPPSSPGAPRSSATRHHPNHHAHAIGVRAASSSSSSSPRRCWWGGPTAAAATSSSKTTRVRTRLNVATNPLKSQKPRFSSSSSPVVDVPPGGASTTTSPPSSDTASPHSSTTAASSSKRKVGRFQSGHYDKPIVLLGCSGAGDELTRLATSLSSSLVGGNKKGGDVNVISALVDDDAGTLNPRLEEEDLNELKLDAGSVIVLDFDHPAFHRSSGSSSSQKAEELKARLSNLAERLYQDEGLLAVYVNVHPGQGRMSPEGSRRRSELETDVFVKYSDYEITVTDEGLFPPRSTGGDDASSAAVNDDGPWSDVEWELNRLIARAMLPPAVPGSSPSELNSASLTMGENTFFLSLSFPTVDEVDPYLERMCQDVDAMELRVDLLDCRTDRFDVLNSHRRLRALCRRHAVRAPALPTPFRGQGQVLDDALPVVYTVRTAHQAGTWPDDADGIHEMFDTLELGLRSGVEVLDVESAWDPVQTDALLTKHDDRGYATQILGSHHVVGTEVSDDEAVRLFRRCRHDGRAHGAKVVLSIDTDESKDRQAFDASQTASDLARSNGEAVIPHISLVLGEKGQYSRVLNKNFTPVTHESLPFVAAPGQLTASQLMSTRLNVGLVKAQTYGILGHNIAYSVSPQMQGAAFRATKLPHTYGRYDVETVEEFINDPTSDWNDVMSFGGCSVTIPHKQSIMSHLDVLSDAAREIGSVNTVIVERVEGSTARRILRGDNTDWIGIYNPLRRKLGGGGGEEAEEKPLSSEQRRGVALILGGGGTARAAVYAAKRLGLDRLYYNRTPSKASELAETFGGTVLSSLGSGQEAEDSLGNVLMGMNGEVRVVISTLPAAAEFVLPEWMLSSPSGGPSNGRPPVVFDVNYKPYHTKLLVQAEEAGCDVVRGSEMLWEQGVGQFELWTGRTAPYRVMKDAVLANCLPPSGHNRGDGSGADDASLEIARGDNKKRPVVAQT